MEEQEWKNFIQIAKENYYKIGAISCPAFGGELVYFNQFGFRHLIIKYGAHRSQDDQSRRLRLVNTYARDIIKSSSKYFEYRNVMSKKSEQVTTMHFWSLKKKVGEKLITVVIRQLDDSEKHFFSIMDKKDPGSAQAP
ncbi:MAG: hypothetical protein AAB470_02730 [Patescibacteria group bacterium]